MKKRLKDLSPTTKIYLKNWYLFKLYLHRKKECLEILRELLLKWRPNIENLNRGEFIREESDYQTLQQMKKMKYKAASDVEVFDKRLNVQQKADLINDIQNFLKKLKFGMEWFYPIKFLLITGFFSPPSMNFATFAGDGVTNEKRVRLELNPDTSIDDIKMHWPLIREFQKELWPNFKKVNLTEKKFTNMGIAVRDLQLRSKGKFICFDPKKLSDSEYKAYDIDIAGSLWTNEDDISKEADYKRRNNLRQIRRRFKQIA